MKQVEIEAQVLGDESPLIAMVRRKERLAQLKRKIEFNDRQLTRNLLKYLKRVQG